MKCPHVFRHLGTAAAAIGLTVMLANIGGAQGASSTFTVPVSVMAGKSEPASGLKQDDFQVTCTATTITTGSSSNTGVTRYLGLFASNANGVGTFTGTDSSSLTYTLSVP